MHRIASPIGKLVISLAVIAALAWAAVIATPFEKAGPEDQTISERASKMSDVELYELVAERVAGGQGYYEAAVELQREGDYPLRPASTVRFPTLAHIASWITPVHGTIALLLANILLWAGLFPGNIFERITACILLAIAAPLSFYANAAYLHDLWAGLLLGIALALHSDRRWWATLLFTTLAVAIREHAILFGAVFGAVALFYRRWPEVIGWSLLGLAFVVGEAAHHLAVAQLVADSDKVSGGWFWLQGPKAFVNDVLVLSLLYLLPMWLAGPLTLLPFLGWASLEDKRPLLVFASYALLFCFFGRENNFYWGLLVLPAYLAGLALTPRAIVRFWKAVPEDGGR